MSIEVIHDIFAPTKNPRTVDSKELSRSARRSFRRMILSCKVFRSVKIQKNTQFTQYSNVI